MNSYMDYMSVQDPETEPMMSTGTSSIQNLLIIAGEEEVKNYLYNPLAKEKNWEQAVKQLEEARPKGQMNLL